MLFLARIKRCPPNAYQHPCQGQTQYKNGSHRSNSEGTTPIRGKLFTNHKFIHQNIYQPQLTKGTLIPNYRFSTIQCFSYIFVFTFQKTYQYIIPLLQLSSHNKCLHFSSMRSDITNGTKYRPLQYTFISNFKKKPSVQNSTSIRLTNTMD